MNKVSIIIPVYNAEEYLCRCVDSCLNQTLPSTEYEIILIDDCSTDRSPDLIREYSANYSNITSVFSYENLRQGGARNLGLKIATGEYIAFVDADDWIECNMCEKLYNAAKINNSDMSGGNYFISTEQGIDRIVICDYPSGKIWDNSTIYMTNCGFFVTRIYRRQFLIENNLFFPERMFYEDAYFNFLSSLYANHIEKVEESFYHYFQRPNSTVHTRNNKYAYNRIDMAELIYSDCQKRGLLKNFKNIIEYKYLLMQSSNILFVCLDGFDIPNTDKIGNIAYMVKTNIPKFKNNPYYRTINICQRFYLNLAILNPKLAVWCHKHKIQKCIELVQLVMRKLHFSK